MSIRYPTLATAVLLGVMLLAGPIMSAHAGDGACTKDKSAEGSTSAAYPTVTLRY